MISLFIPMYNEESIIEKNILTILDYVTKLPYDIKLILVDDCSTDKTQIIGQSLAKKYNEIYYQRFEIGPSRRENLALAMSKSRDDILIFMDLDLATDLNHLENLIKAILCEGFDISTGSRYKGINPRREFSRLIISKIYNNFMKIFFQSKVSDHQCGFKAFRKDVFMHLIKEMSFDKKFNRGWFWDAEILIRAQKDKLRIKEIPVKWTRGEKSSFSIKRELKMLKYVLKLRRRLN